MARDEDEEGISRRTWLKGALAVGAATVATTGGYAAFRTLAGGDDPPVPRETFLYIRLEGARLTPWYVERGLVGTEARLDDFQVGDGANVQWRWHLGEGGEPEGGVSALLMRVPPEDLAFPEGFPREEFVVEGLYAVFNCCTHACCRTGWRLVPRTMYKNDLGFDTIFCPCHCAQFHPTRVAVFTHPGPPEGSGARYIGVADLAGPVDRGMPLIPIEVQGGRIIGKLKEPDWYRYLDTMRHPLP